MKFKFSLSATTKCKNNANTENVYCTKENDINSCVLPAFLCDYAFINVCKYGGGGGFRDVVGLFFLQRPWEPYYGTWHHELHEIPGNLKSESGCPCHETKTGSSLDLSEGQ